MAAAFAIWRGGVTIRCAGVTIRCAGVTIWFAGVTIRCVGVTIRCAGVTIRCAGVTIRCAGVTIRCAGVTIRCAEIIIIIYKLRETTLPPSSTPPATPAALNFTDLGGCEGDGAPGSLDKQKQCNLRLVRRQFFAASNSPSIFFGGPLLAGSNNFPCFSPIENSPHSPVHLTTGSDMSVVTKAAVDPLFLPHHANIDRLWAIWDGLQGNISKVFDDADFLDASFLFWDEKMQRVRVHVRDIIDTRKLGYVYENVPLKWMNIETTVEDETRILCSRNFSQPNPAITGGVKFPLPLSSAARVKVRRAPGESGGEKLVVFEIELDGRDEVWFDVYVSRVGGGGGRAQAGSFIHMERSSDKKIAITTEMQVGIAEVIKQIGAADDDQIVVTLDPKIGGEKMTVGGHLEGVFCRASRILLHHHLDLVIAVMSEMAAVCRWRQGSRYSLQRVHPLLKCLLLLLEGGDLGAQSAGRRRVQ
ncbi:hypothetical protein KSP39_PZI022439 [Platanthera zijinensis]|uniref:Tyrosinase copper-binding domain-containing protein n=1 Tax=Platanthera zijinensis TaxID=2320716 RepID=A0AAP0FVC5_9ASPA